MTAETRAQAVVRAYDRMPDPKDDLQIMLMEVMDGMPDGSPYPDTEVHRTIRASFSGDDDFDDLRHEIDHELGQCADGDEDCPWTDDDLDD